MRKSACVGVYQLLNIQVVYMHVMLATNGIAKYFLKEGVSITN